MSDGNANRDWEYVLHSPAPIEPYEYGHSHETAFELVARLSSTGWRVLQVVVFPGSIFTRPEFHERMGGYRDVVGGGGSSFAVLAQREVRHE